MDRVGGQLAAVAIAGEQRLAADAATFNEWLQARRANDRVLQAMLVRRFSPEYHNPQLEQAEHLNEEAAATEEEGTHARETAEKYIGATVLFALVLFLVA